MTLNLSPLPTGYCCQLTQTSLTEHPVGMNWRCLWTAWLSVKSAHKMVKSHLILILHGRKWIVTLQSIFVSHFSYKKLLNYAVAWFKTAETANQNEDNISTHSQSTENKKDSFERDYQVIQVNLTSHFWIISIKFSLTLSKHIDSP